MTNENPEKLYSVAIPEGLKPEERADVAELLQSRGWQIVVRLLSNAVRKYETVLHDPTTTDQVKLSILNRWTGIREIYQHVQGLPGMCQVQLELESQHAAEPTFAPTPRMPLAAHALPNAGISRIK